jgi:hypothetical protein
MKAGVVTFQHIDSDPSISGPRNWSEGCPPNRMPLLGGIQAVVAVYAEQGVEVAGCLVRYDGAVPAEVALSLLEAPYRPNDLGPICASGSMQAVWRSETTICEAEQCECILIRPHRCRVLAFTLIRSKGTEVGDVA